MDRWHGNHINILHTPPVVVRDMGGCTIHQLDMPLGNQTFSEETHLNPHFRRTWTRFALFGKLLPLSD